jgi:hypothetical protein
MRTGGRAVAVSDNQRVVGVGLQQLIVGVERIGLARAIECAFRQVDVGLGDHAADVFKTDAAGRQSLGIDLDADRRLHLPADAD